MSLVELIKSIMEQTIDGAAIGMHLGMDRFGYHNIESNMFLLEPDNYLPETKQKVDEIYGLRFKGEPLFEGTKKAFSVLFYLPGVAFYPFEKAIQTSLGLYDSLSAKYPVLKKLSTDISSYYSPCLPQQNYLVQEQLEKNSVEKNPSETTNNPISSSINSNSLNNLGKVVNQ